MDLVQIHSFWDCPEPKLTKIRRIRSASKMIVSSFSKTGNIATIALEVRRNDWYVNVCLSQIFEKIPKN
jgi:hypothetical protein